MNIYLISIWLGVVEGLTEFLPVSSTAHLRIAQSFLGIDLRSPYWQAYSIVIQLGAILSVVAYFRERLWAFVLDFSVPGRHSLAEHGTEDGGAQAANLEWLKQTLHAGGARSARSARAVPARGFWRQPLMLVLIAFVATALPAFALRKIVHANLESLHVMAAALVLGGIAMALIEFLCTKPRTERIVDMTPVQAVWIGLVQILSAVFPGTSRSMATIAGGQTVGLSRRVALEFSFFVGIPLMFAAAGYELYKLLREEALALSGEEWGALAVGFAVSFATAWGVIAWFLHWVRRHGFLWFALYRIALGLGLWWWAQTLTSP